MRRRWSPSCPGSSRATRSRRMSSVPTSPPWESTSASRSSIRRACARTASAPGTARSSASGPATPLAGCRKPAAPGRALLLLKDRTPDTLDALLWKWAGGAATTKADFGNPVATTNYQLCLYDQSGATATLRLASNVPAGGTCGARPCWTGTTTGFVYADPALTPDGLATISERGAGAGAAKLLIKGEGTNLPLSRLPPGPPGRVP